ncbi:MAG: LysR family transcriptional regulator, partial [Alcaligenaceae bacterium]|nr:LysR family transcriptional regulator [Alcaligenaceae bacterium]
VKVHDPAIARVTYREERLALAMPGNSALATPTGPICLSAVTDQSLIVYPSQPRPSFADYILNTLQDKQIYPADIKEVLSLQTALGLVAAGDGLCVIPTGARIRQDIQYRLIRDKDVSSPIIFSFRKKDSSWYINAMQDLVQDMYSNHPDLLHPDNCINS